MKSNEIRTSITPVVWNRISYMVILLVLVVLSSVSTFASENEQAETSEAPGACRILAEGNRIEIPFDIFRGDIRFRCEVNGHKVHMLLDDGYMWNQLLFWGSPRVDSLDFVYDGEIGIGDENSEQLISKTASGITVSFPGVEFTDQSAVITPFNSGNSRMWFGSVGQISATFFKHFVVEIDFDRMIITLHEPRNYEYKGGGVAVPWRPLGFGPWSIPATLQMENGRQVSMTLMMDLGYNDQLQLTLGGKHNILLPERKLPASLGFNIQRLETRGFVGRIPQIKIGDYQIHDLIASFVSEGHSDQVEYEGMIGLGLLSRFNLVFDYHRKQLFVEPNNSFKTPFEYNMSGFVMRPAIQGYSTIVEVYRDSPAEEAGLKVGDKIISINDRVMTDYDFFELDSIFKKEGLEVNLIVESNGEKKRVSLKLRRVI